MSRRLTSAAITNSNVVAAKQAGLAVPDDLYKKAVELAAKDRVSVEEFVSTVLADRVASREFIESRARLFDR